MAPRPLTKDPMQNVWGQPNIPDFTTDVGKRISLTQLHLEPCAETLRVTLCRFLCAPSPSDDLQLLSAICFCNESVHSDVLEMGRVTPFALVVVVPIAMQYNPNVMEGNPPWKTTHPNKNTACTDTFGTVCADSPTFFPLAEHRLKIFCLCKLLSFRWLFGVVGCLSLKMFSRSGNFFRFRFRLRKSQAMVVTMPWCTEPGFLK